jgi:uncharacterized protein YhbP (UPF0306 family)
MHSPDPAFIARSIIKANRYLTLACGSDDDIWISPLAYAVEPDYCFLFYSATDSLHARLIRRNSKVAVAIFDSREPSDTADGIQFSATVEEVKTDELARVIDLYFRQSFPNPETRSRWIRPEEDFVDKAIQRFYRIRPVSMFKPDPASPKVDRRIEIDLDKLRSLPLD